MTLVDDNIFPKLILAEGSAPSSPSAGDFKLYFDSSDHLLKWKNSAGTVTTVATGSGASGSITASGYTQSTAKMLGRSTASTGAIEEITVGTGLSLSAGSLTATGGGGSGALAFLEAHTASSSATLDFTSFISSTYDDYLIEGIDVVPASNGVNLGMQVGTGGGPTYDTGSNYYGSVHGVNSNAGASGGTYAPGSAYTLAVTVANAANYGHCNFSIRLFNPQSGANKNVVGNAIWHDGSAVAPGMIGGLWAVTTVITAVRFFFSSGNIASGTIRAYGITKS